MEYKPGRFKHYNHSSPMEYKPGRLNRMVRSTLCLNLLLL